MLDLPDGEAHHVFKVLRGREGDLVEIVDGTGRLFAGELLGGRRAAVRNELEAVDTEGVEVTLYQAVPKGGRMDLVVEKATEVGVSRIVPLVSERSIVSPREGKVGRWRRMAEAAARQSLRLRVPAVEEPVRFEQAVRSVGEVGVLLHNDPGLESLEGVVGTPACLFVGPEGGWTGAELRLAEEAGLVLAGLGPYRLRSETAGIVAVARARAAREVVRGVGDRERA
ncbi:MAG: RsmE family RNA methyltransferase [Rubrobacter sp.]